MSGILRLSYDCKQRRPDDPGTGLDAQIMGRPLGHMHLCALECESVTETSFVLKQTHLSLLCGVFLLEFNCFNITPFNCDF